MLKKKQFSAYVGYLIFGVVCLLLNLYWTFPAVALGQRVVHEVEKQTGGVWKVQFKDAAPYRLSGLELQDVTITKRESPTAEPLVLQVDALRARVRLLPLLLLRMSVSAQVKLGGGTLGAVVTPLKDRTDANIYADDVDLGKTAVFAKLSGMPLNGVLNGTVDAHWTVDPHKVDTDADLSIDAAGVGPGKVANLVTIPAVTLGDLAVKAEIKEGRVKITQFKQGGGNVNIHLQASGNGSLNQPLFTSNMEGCVAFKAEPTFLNTNPTMRAALQLAEVQLKKDPEGYLNVPIAGAVNGLQVRVGNLCKK